MGKYVIHIDSDGILQYDALKNMITDFENASKTRQISRMEFIRINNESNKSIDRNSDIIHNFKTKTKSLKKTIFEDYKR